MDLSYKMIMCTHDKRIFKRFQICEEFLQVVFRLVKREVLGYIGVQVFHMFKHTLQQCTLFSCFQCERLVLLLRKTTHNIYILTLSTNI